MRERIIKFRGWDGEGMYYGGFSIHAAGDVLSDMILPKVVMQFTGLKDKNGKEIYEGDILEVRSFQMTVVWFSEGACFRYAVGDKDLESPLNYDDVEVIGNIYENPSLINLKE